MTIVLSDYSEKRLLGVRNSLVKVVREAALLTEGMDWRVGEGMRTLARQKQLVASGASQTLNSYHLEGRAVDLHALIGKKVAWDWPLYWRIARFMRAASIKTGVPIVWGGVWDKELSELSDDLGKEVQAYCARHKGRDFIDGPHFQLPRNFS